MPFDYLHTRNRKGEQIGQLTDLLTFYTPVKSYTATGGESVSWLEWTSTRGKASAQRGNETVEDDRRIARNTKTFIVRRMAVPNVNETMMLTYRGEQYMIHRIDMMDDVQPRNMYITIEATRRDEAIAPVSFLANQMYMDWSQNFTNVTANYVQPSGTIISTADYTTSEINQLLYVFRSGLRLVYGQAGDGGYTIDNATNRITANLSFAGENVLVHQYQTSSS